MLLELNLMRADLRIENGQMLEGLGLLQAMLPEAKVYTAIPELYCRTMLQIADVFLQLDRDQEAHEMAAEAVAFAKEKFDLEDSKTLKGMNSYAIACAKLGRVEEAKAAFEDVLSIETRVLGRDHPHTQFTSEKMRKYGFGEPSG